jgi:DNA-3-methyladenine glycosylase
VNLRRNPLEVARDLIGAELTFGGVGGVIVECEAYDHEDPASHAYLNRRSPRNGSMFLGGGYVYVYRSMGIHWCMNIVCGEPGVAGAVLLRALEPTRGIDAMIARRGLSEPRLLCSGPGRLCQALGISREQDGLRVDEPPFALVDRAAPVEIVTGPRIGISKAAEVPWRFGLAGSKFLSRPFSRR